MPTMFAVFLLAASCTSQEMTVSSPPTAKEQSSLEEAVTKAQNEDPSLKRFFDESHAYVVFPSIEKGGFIVGGAHGTGWVYERGRLIGKAEVSAVSVGAQVGGEAFTEIIFMKDAHPLNNFKSGKLDLGANASAVLVKQGAATAAGYDSSGLAIFTMTNGGAMAAATVGGQKFTFEPILK